MYPSLGNPRATTSVQQSILNLILSSNWKLTIVSKQSVYDRTLIILDDFQMFELKSSRLDGEIQFSRAMRAFKKDTRAQWAKFDTVDSTDLATKHSTLEVKFF